jgi:hypothetical protein
MKRVLLFLALCAIGTGASAQVVSVGSGGGLSAALANALYCQLSGCTMTGALTSSSSGVIFNGTTVKTGGANILNIANGTNAQSLRVYNTDDGAGNAEYGMLDWASQANVLHLDAVKTGTGAQRQISINGSAVNIQVAGTTRMAISATGIVPSSAGSTLDLGSTTSTQMFRHAYVTTSIQGGAVKTLTETSATGFVTVAIPNSGGCAGYVDYTVFAADATNTQLKSGQLYFSAAATSGGTVTAATISDVNTLNPVTSGTLSNTMTQTTGANLITLLANATSSLTQTTLEIRYRVMLQGGTCTVTGL